MLSALDRGLAWHLPGNLPKDVYARGMRRLAEYGLFRGTHEVTTRYGFAMTVNRIDAIKWCIYYFGQFEPRISRAFANLLRPGDQVVDIGANVGYHTLLAATRVGPSGRVLAFEPSRRNFAELAANVALNGLTNVTLRRQAVSDESGSVALFFGGDSEQGDSSLVREHPGGQSELVEAVTFDDIAGSWDLSQVALIKIDVEGVEERVIRRMAPHLDRLRPDCAIFLEISPGNAARHQAILAPLAEHGFAARRIANEYNTPFFRSNEPVVLTEPQIVAGEIVDLVLARDPATFARLSG